MSKYVRIALFLFKSGAEPAVIEEALQILVAEGILSPRGKDRVTRLIDRLAAAS